MIVSWEDFKNKYKKENFCLINGTAFKFIAEQNIHIMITCCQYNKPLVQLYTFLVTLQKMENQFNDGIQPNYGDGPALRFCQQDSGFKAWQSRSFLAQNNTNLLRNLKSQLASNQQKYKKLNPTVHTTLPVKLPFLDHFNSRKHQFKAVRKQQNGNDQKQSMTERRNIRKQQGNKQNLFRYKSIELKKKSISEGAIVGKKTRDGSLKIQNKTNKFIDSKEQKPILITKVQEMKFAQNQKRIRKRDIYLTIFGQRGKGKVQKISFDEENKPYQIYLQRKNQQSRIIASLNTNKQSKQQNAVKKSTSQLNSRCNTKKKSQEAPQYINILNNNNKTSMTIRF